jgi:hypothetical protein
METTGTIPIEDGCPRKPADQQYVCLWEATHWFPDTQIPAVTEYVKGVESVTAWQIGWKSEWGTPPMTCSYCGGARPADILRLMVDGWEVEACDKPYKRYLQPPGYARNCARVLESIRSGEHFPDFQSPVPPVKVYSYHFTREEVGRFNQILRERT